MSYRPIHSIDIKYISTQKKSSSQLFIARLLKYSGSIIYSPTIHKYNYQLVTKDIITLEE